MFHSELSRAGAKAQRPGKAWRVFRAGSGGACLWQRAYRSMYSEVVLESPYLLEFVLDKLKKD